ncbi:Ejaculatory bulb protein III [Carabus blaptoides fortunei]
MLLLTVFTCVVPAALALTITEDGYYDTRYNHLDIERILNNKRLVTYYAMCLIGTGPCTPQGTEFKRILPEALKSNCARCTEKQQVTAYLAIRRLKKEYPKIWSELQGEWDPTGEYVSTFVNTIETNSRASDIPTTSKIIITGRFGDADNEISSSSSANKVNLPVPSLAPSASEPLPNTQTSTTTQKIPNAPTSASDTTRKHITTERYTTTSEISYRTGSRPNRFNLLLPRPEIGLRLTANWISSIGDIGTKVIKTGARIADMVLSNVQATFG